MLHTSILIKCKYTRKFIVRVSSTRASGKRYYKLLDEIKVPKEDEKNLAFDPQVNLLASYTAKVSEPKGNLSKLFTDREFP